MAALPIPTTNLAIIRNNREVERADRIEPRVKTRLPHKSVFLLPNISPSFPRIGAQVAVDIA